MAYLKFKKPDEPSIKTLIPRGKKFKRLFIGSLIINIITIGIIVVLAIK